MVMPLQDKASWLCIKAVALSLALTGSSYAQKPLDTASAKAQAASTTDPDSSRKYTDRELRQAEDAYLEGARLLDHGQLAAAENAFLRAAKIIPTKPEYVQAATLAHEHRVTELVQQAGKARLLGHPQQADALLAQANALDPNNNIVSQHLNTVS